MNGLINECTYRTPCGWCSKWDKHCDKKEGPEAQKTSVNFDGDKLLQTLADVYPTIKSGEKLLKGVDAK